MGLTLDVVVISSICCLGSFCLITFCSLEETSSVVPSLTKIVDVSGTEKLLLSELDGSSLIGNVLKLNLHSGLCIGRRYLHE